MSSTRFLSARSAAHFTILLSHIHLYMTSVRTFAHNLCHNQHKYVHIYTHLVYWILSPISFVSIPMLFLANFLYFPLSLLLQLSALLPQFSGPSLSARPQKFSCLLGNFLLHCLQFSLYIFAFITHFYNFQQAHAPHSCQPLSWLVSYSQNLIILTEIHKYYWRYSLVKIPWYSLFARFCPPNAFTEVVSLCCNFTHLTRPVPSNALLA